MILALAFERDSVVCSRQKKEKTDEKTLVHTWLWINDLFCPHPRGLWKLRYKWNWE